MPILDSNFAFDFQVVFKAIHLISIMGNDGTFNKPLTQILLDWELSYNVLYLLLCISGLCVHPFFFSGIWILLRSFPSELRNIYGKYLYIFNWFDGHFQMTFKNYFLMKLSNEPNNIFQSKSQNYKYIQRSIQILFFPVLLFEMVKREETLLNVMQSVTKNIRSILFTALLAIILVYLFSIVGFVFFQEDFLIEAEDLPSAPSSSCQGKFIYMLPFSM